MDTPHFYSNAGTTTSHSDPQIQHQYQQPVFFVANGGTRPIKTNQTPSPPTPDTSSLSRNSSHHNLHRNGSSSDLNLHKIQRGTTAVKPTETCRVCGDTPARPHYGIVSCFGCKGFFRRTLKRTKEYTCRYNGNCVVDKYERNSCRFCRFKRCLDIGMDPKAVRPDRDAAGRSHAIRHRRSRVSLGELANIDDEDPTDEWIRKLPVNSGDNHSDPMQVYPLQIGSLRQILEDPTLLDGKRTEMSYEPYRRVKAEEMVAVAHRRLVAVIDMVDHLSLLMDLHNIHDKLALVKAAYAPLALFCTVAATAQTTRDRDVFCLCCCGYIARGTAMRNYEPYHFTNGIVERALDELVEPFRAFNFKDQEIALMKAIVTLNPHIRALSTEAAEQVNIFEIINTKIFQVADMRDRIQETLYNVVRESHPKEVASSRFGNLLLFLPNIMLLGSTMYENLQFLQSFSQRKVDPLLAELLDNLEPIQDNGVNPDDIFCITPDRTDSQMRTSQSNSSLSSVSSHESYQNGINNQPNMSDDYYARRQSADSCLPLSTSAPTSMVASFLINGIPNQSQQESDPDYNLTLTAETFSGMRQAIAQSMEIDHEQSMADYYNQQPAQQKPRFYIDSYQQPQPVHSTISARHIFTVEATKDPTYSLAGQMQNPNFLAFQNAQTFSQQAEINATAPSISKSQSYPHFPQQFVGYSQPQQQFQNGAYNQQQR